MLLSTFIIATPYFGRELLVPLALAALLTFMLAPLVTLVQKRLGRVIAVLLVVLAMYAAVPQYHSELLIKYLLDFIHDELDEIMEETDLRQEVLRAPEEAAAFRVCAVPAKARRDELAANILIHLLHQQGHATTHASARIDVRGNDYLGARAGC